MEANFNKLNLSDPNVNSRFAQLTHEYNPQLLNYEQSTLTPTAAEFYPSNRLSAGHDENGHVINEKKDNASSVNQSGGGGGAGTLNDERNKGAIRKQYTNSRNYQNRRYNGNNSSRYYRDNRNSYSAPNRHSNEEQDCFFHDNYRNNRQNYGHREYYNNYREHRRERSDYKENKFKQYKQNKVPVRFPQKLDSSQCSQREKLTKEIESYSLECLVCCENIKATQSIWSCSNCYHILHLNCITKWATSSKSDDGWRCPACNVFRDKVPREYYCFCGKLKNPTFNRNDIAHSCGDVCGRTCEQGEHSCTMLCHPGPCNPCQASVVKHCPCNKTSKLMQCCQKEDVLCREMCGKLLNCFQHTCDKLCHRNECGPCDKKIKQICMCGKSDREVDCTPENNEIKIFQCDNVCDKLLRCEHHHCKEKCHPPPCSICQLSPEFITSCPCGKMPIQPKERKSCMDEIPLCKSVCKRPLPCGPPSNPHFCSSKCHTGPCPPCNKTTKVKCRCGHMDQEIKCKSLTSRADDARCKKRCTKMKSCGRHKCLVDCCIDIDHICLQICNKMLTCRKHRCMEQCHKGPCKPCLISSFDELYCECGANVIYPPIPCGTKKPVCDKPCSRSHPCDHEVLHNCHTAAKCPPCVVLTSKYCYGKHELRKTIPCHEESFSCGLPCGKSLPCGRHSCQRPCHKDECVKDGEVCKQRCNKARLDCLHQCGAQCHDSECPDLLCKENVEITCECGNRKQTRTCGDFSREYRRIVTAQLASSMADMQNGASIQLSDILGPIKKGNNKTLECNDECRLLERNRRLEIALGPSKEVPRQIPAYSEFLKTFAKKDMNLIKDIHEKLTNLVKLAKESKQKSRSHSFPVMNREKRQVVHEMCEIFGIQSQAYDAEPHRNVVATAQRELCYYPTMSLMEVIQREAGQRVRLPLSQNAWRTTTTTTK